MSTGSVYRESKAGQKGTGHPTAISRGLLACPSTRRAREATSSVDGPATPSLLLLYMHIAGRYYRSNSRLHLTRMLERYIYIHIYIEESKLQIDSRNAGVRSLLNVVSIFITVEIYKRTGFGESLRRHQL